MIRAAAVLCLIAAPVMAQNPNCAEREQVVSRLAERYGETLQSMGLRGDNGVMEIYASEETGTWTILITGPDGMACMVAAGELWEGDAAPLTPPGDDL
jgi:hypothetical protein